MLFNSLTFVVFFALVLCLHNLPFPWRAKKINLLLASYFFYAVWNPPFVVLLWISTLVDWYVARALHVAQGKGRRRGLLAISLLVNLGVLGYFKYGSFLLENFTAMLNAMGVDFHPAAPSIILPVGISFYTFQTLAYSLDIYLKRAKPTESALDFALFVTFFPQLVAGPIVRPGDLVPQFAAPKRASAGMLRWGLALMTLGLFEKVVMADGVFAPAVDLVFGAAGPVSALDAWLGTLAFSGQIFCDFAGYSTTAIGAALCLGFHLPNNFRFPYAAIGFSDFWRRWHISLSTWLRDYLYIPLGGNRKGARRTYINLSLTMLLGGLWHGAAWTFVVWGGLHGLYLMIERAARGSVGSEGERIISLPGRIGLVLMTYLAIDITWVFFRAQSLGSAWEILRSMFLFNEAGAAILPQIYVLQASIGIALLLVVQFLMRDRTLEGVASRTSPWLFSLIWAALVFGLIITQGGSSSFIYFQF